MLGRNRKLGCRLGRLRRRFGSFRDQLAGFGDCFTARVLARGRPVEIGDRKIELGLADRRGLECCALPRLALSRGPLSRLALSPAMAAAAPAAPATPPLVFGVRFGRRLQRPAMLAGRLGLLDVFRLLDRRRAGLGQLRFVTAPATAAAPPPAPAWLLAAFAG